MLSHALEGWMMSKLLSLKAAKLSLFVSSAGLAADISWHYADAIIPLRSQATLLRPYEFFFVSILPFAIQILFYIHELRAKL